ncbi:MAG: HDIG domain-containing protein [Acidobacteria bacterium]|nr:HDIG domain-containing protein [Acidobacteriota bacterium]
MVESSKPLNRRRSAFANPRKGLQRLWEALYAELSPLELLLGLVFTIIVASLLVGYQFESLPDYKIGDIADRNIEASYNFTVEDTEATLRKEQETLEAVPGIFNLDLRINSRIEGELRAAFAEGRVQLEQEKSHLNLRPAQPLPQGTRQRLLPLLIEKLPRLDQEGVLETLLDHSFSQDLENQMVRLLQEAMKYPGVVLSRDPLGLYQSRGIILRNTVSGQDEMLEDWTSVRDLEQARNLLRHSSFELTQLKDAEREKVVRFLERRIVPNLAYNAAASGDLEELALREVDPVLIQVKKGRTLVRAGDEIRARELMLVNALKRLKQPRRLLGQFVGIGLLVGCLLYALWHYLLAHQERHKKIRNHYVLLVLVLAISLIVTRLFMALADVVAQSLATESLRHPSHFYLFAPFALGALLIILLVDVNFAVLYSVTFALCTALMSGEISLFVYALMGSWAAIYALDQYRERSVIVRAGAVIGAVNVLVAFALQLYQGQNGFNWDLFALRSVGGLTSGLFAAMLASLLLPVLESLFEITTDIRLLELSNLNTELLRKLALEAPGTYHHSIMVGTLGEAAAEAIGANALLVRVGAYYHDIGKMKKPEYYVENQIYTANKHENLSPSMSSLIIASHVKDGLAMAEEANLVPKVRDMIPQHHGTRLMTYFYQKAKEAAEEKGEEVSENDFRYPGPRPQTKEAAILMLSDQVEAAARTLQDPAPGQIRSMIRRLVQSTIQDGQFDECDITMSELEKISQAFERVITTMYHHRIEYPGFDFKKDQPVEESMQPEVQRI